MLPLHHLRYRHSGMHKIVLGQAGKQGRNRQHSLDNIGKLATPFMQLLRKAAQNLLRAHKVRGDARYLKR